MPGYKVLRLGVLCTPIMRHASPLAIASRDPVTCASLLKQPRIAPPGGCRRTNSSHEPATGHVILDARSSDKYRELHVSGAVNLGYPDITVEGLQRLIPDKRTTVLIYCNNNFVNAEGPFPSKLARSLNLSTYITLYDYGYRNVHELGPTIDPARSPLEFHSGQGR